MVDTTYTVHKIWEPILLKKVDEICFYHALYKQGLKKQGKVIPQNGRIKKK